MSFPSVKGYNQGQYIVAKLIKLSKLGVLLECFTVEYSQLPGGTVQIWFWDGQLGTCH